MAAETRMMLGASFDACNVGEATLAHRLLTDVPANSLTLFDRCYFSADLLINWQKAAPNSHWLTLIKRKLRYEVIEEYADNDMLIEMPISPQARKKNPELPATWQVRLVLYKDPTGEIEGFITSLADPNQSPLRVSFTAAINLIYTQLRWLVLSPDGTLPAKLKQMREAVSYFILPDKRKDRTYPRSALFVPAKYPVRYKR